ncbi:MAG TPA: LacI family DNA-binding transcriptional regulator [Candidatus Baltobacteraceae bacterium]|nr:LacI family DNA-binding transcriptional regulator [Candidatus Baltobacteraceae bacterium]
MKRRARITDVAARAHVSVASVSRALNDSSAVTEAVRERVLRAAAELHYSIDQRARALRQLSSRTFGAIISDVSNPYFSEVLLAIEAVTDKSERNLFLCNSGEDEQREMRHIHSMVERRIDGVLIFPISRSSRTLRPFVDAGIPVVTIDREVDHAAHDAVVLNNVRGSMLAVEHLLALGHRRIAFIGGYGNSPADGRLEGYRSALAAHGVVERKGYVRYCDLMQNGGNVEMKRLLALRVRPSAVIAINHLVTLGALTAIGEQRLAIPRDISIVGFDNPPWVSLLAPPLTTIHQPTDQLGEIAARMLIERADGKYSGKRRRVVVEPTLVELASTAPPRE